MREYGPDATASIAAMASRSDVTVDGELFADRLPTYLTRFVGREREIAALENLLWRHRVVTLCGVGGAGKTRLAIEVARRVRTAPSDDVAVYWVSLSSATTSDDVLAALAAGISTDGPVSPTVAALKRALRFERALLVLDNCEQVARACANHLAEILATCPMVAVIATSHIPLRLGGEEIYAMPALDAANELFLDRAVMRAPTYASTARNAGVIAEICALLDGLPLAIELAASWIPVLSPRDLLTQLTEVGDSLESRSATIAGRHRSMDAVLEASWRWLGHDEQEVLSALAIFVGGFTREAAKEVTGATLGSLAALVERALIQRQPEAAGGSRYAMHELIRLHALRHLRNADTVRSRHFAFMLTLVERRLVSGGTAAEAAWLHPMGLELGNIDAATRWALSRKDALGALRMATALCPFWNYSSPPASTRLDLLERALALPWDHTDATSTQARAGALSRAGWVQLLFEKRIELSRGIFAEATRLFLRVGDVARAAGCLRGHACAQMELGDLEGCRRDVLKSRALCTASGDDQGEAWCVVLLGGLALADAESATARRHLEDAVGRFERAGVSFSAFWSRILLAEACRRQRDWTSAITASRRALDSQISRGFTAVVTDFLDELALLAADHCLHEEAAELMGSAETWRLTHQEVSDVIFRNVVRSGAPASRAQLGDTVWFAARERGSSLSSNDAMRRAGEVLGLIETKLRASSSGLTRREVEILRLVAQGLRNGEVAERLCLSDRTVHAHLRSAFERLGVTNRTAAVREAAGVLQHPL